MKHQKRTRAKCASILRCIGLIWMILFVLALVYIAVIIDQQHNQQAAGVWRNNNIVPVPKANDIRQPGELNCPGVAKDQSQEMVYWKYLSLDHQYLGSSKERPPSYLTFVMDEGGYNNIRMAYETILAMAHAMGRTLVLPPAQEFYLLDSHKNGQRHTFGFQDFFPLERIDGVHIISTREFLEQVTMRGNLKDRVTGRVKFPPHNRTVWDGDENAILNELQPYLESVSFLPEWSPDRCLLAFPAKPNDTTLAKKFHAIQSMGGFRSPESYVGSPTAVYGSTIDRLGEVLNGRTELCLYNQTNEFLIHMHGKRELGGRLLTHFYAFLFFEDWKQDLWTKRFIRDQLHYRDEIQCTAANIVAEIRQRYKVFDAFHVRRGEFQYKRTRVSAQEMYEIAKDQIPENATVYIATDERNHRFFDDLGKHYHLLFLDDFHHLLTGINTNFWGLIDQLVASRSRTFFGCWFSTYVFSFLVNSSHKVIIWCSFTSYINRLRGCKLCQLCETTLAHKSADHNDLVKGDGFASGIIDSYYYAIPERKWRMREYWPISGAVYAREFPMSWRNIDHGID